MSRPTGTASEEHQQLASADSGKILQNPHTPAGFSHCSPSFLVRGNQRQLNNPRHIAAPFSNGCAVLGHAIRNFLAAREADT
jgi:hypothetical protein